MRSQIYSEVIPEENTISMNETEALQKTISEINLTASPETKTYFVMQNVDMD